MIKGFKEFILRGNVIDLAVAVVIGAAFTGIVNALVEGFINPLIGVIFQVGDLSSWVWEVPTLSGGTSTFAIGSIIGALINFRVNEALIGPDANGIDRDRFISTWGAIYRSVLREG